MIEPMKWVWLALLCGVMAGCNGTPCRFSVKGDPRMPFFEVGALYEGKVRFAIFCPNEKPLELSIAGALVVDEDNHEVPSEWSLSTPESDVTLATLKFTPVTAGRHHFSLRVQPDIGITQGDIFSASPPSAARVVLDEVPIPSGLPCGRIALLPGGTLACTTLLDELVFVRDGAVQQLIGKQGVSVPWVRSGPVVWVWNESRITRWVETDAGMTREPTQPSPLVNSFPMVATEREMFTFGGGPVESSLTRWSVDGGMLTGEPFPMPAPEQADVYLNGLGEFTVDRTAWWVGGPSHVCRIALDAGTPRCFALTDVRGYGRAEADGYWFSPARLELGHMNAEGVAQVTTLPPTYDVQGAPLVRAQAFTGESTDFYLAVPGDAGLRYERLEGKYTGGWADGDRLLLLSRDKVTVMQR